MLRSWVAAVVAACLMLGVVLGSVATAWAERSLGLDVSAWQGSISQSNWNTLKNTNDREFVFIRSSRGGTTGVYNQSDPNNNRGGNTLSQRYDDPYFVQNITRATNAGIYAGPYHFARPDIVSTTFNAGGIANTGVDEANHFLAMAGAWMRPGYLLPVFDLEAGINDRSPQALTQFSIDFSERIEEATGVKPVMYINGSYSEYVDPSIVDHFSAVWIARYAYQDNPSTTAVQTANPKDTFDGFYGAWDDPADPHPWDFWQYATTGRLSGYRNGSQNLDFNVAQGGTEFVKDFLVPALWMSDSSGDWSTLASWNSGAAPVAPVQGPGQSSRVGAMVLPTPRLPGADDTVILERDNADITVTMSTGVHEVRKLVVREQLDLSGGVLLANYTPVADSTSYTVLVDGALNLTGGALSAHTIEVEEGGGIDLSSGVVTFDTIGLASGAGNPATLLVTGEARVGPVTAETAVVTDSTVAGDKGFVGFGAGAALDVFDGAAAVDVSIDAVAVGQTFAKRGDGTLRLTEDNTIGTTIVEQGTLVLGNDPSTGAAASAIEVAADAALRGTGSADGLAYIEGTLAPGDSTGTLSLGSLQLAETSTVEIEIASLSDFDSIDLSGSLFVSDGATIEVDLLDGYIPSVGDSFQIITGASSAGVSFNLVVNSGPDMVIRPVADGLVLEVAADIPGDFNGDGRVDNGDLNLLLADWGESTVSPLWFNGFEGVVDNGELNALLGGWGVSSATSIPEPSTAPALLFAIGGVAWRRRSAV